MKEFARKLIDRLKKVANTLPYLLPAIILSLSLASSLLVADPAKVNETAVAFEGSPPGGGSQSDLFNTIQIQEGEEKTTSDTGDFTVGRNPVNTRPYLQTNPIHHTAIDTPTSFILDAVDDQNNTPIVASVDSQPPHGTVSFVGLQLTFTPEVGYTQPVVIQVRLTDSTSASRIEKVTVQIP